jgi:hypothetical protein
MFLSLLNCVLLISYFICFKLFIYDEPFAMKAFRKPLVLQQFYPLHFRFKKRLPKYIFCHKVGTQVLQ